MHCEGLLWYWGRAEAVGLWFGMIAFSLFFLSDYNDWRMGRKALRLCFPLGGLLLAAGTLLRCGEGEILVSGGAGKAVLFGAAAFLALLIYTLFFAIPAEASYAKPGQKRRVCTTGVYALCRHPGVLWFVGLYACLSAAAGLPAVDSVVYSAANVLLIWFEDRLVFPALMEGYDAYRAKTPFLIPNGRSIRDCFRGKDA